ncbi:hypothetical protein C7M84_006658 [Penaeus vannamei]|uniref:Uncharacterized protein n=1 Tax=Penaeus vannamei TaxID=6689 RepID=A0A3R7P409_PENVA|nr:hypothetical protein C7M84_006658 [Penaeus vannamei]
MTALEVLERKGARLEETTTDGGDTPLHLAASEGHLHVVFLLLSLKVSPQPKNRRGKTPQDVLKRPSATPNCDMEIFRDISKTQIMEKWIESERERSNLTREVRTQQVSARWRSASRPPGMRQGGVQCGNRDLAGAGTGRPCDITAVIITVIFPINVKEKCKTRSDNLPRLSLALTSAPAATKTSTTSSRPSSAASISGCD